MYAIFTCLIHQRSDLSHQHSNPLEIMGVPIDVILCVCVLRSRNSQQNPPKAGQPDINNENIVFLYLFAGSLPGQ